MTNTYHSNAVWHDNLSLNHHILKYEPGNAKVHHNYAMALADRGKKEDAMQHYQQSIALKGAYPETHHNLGRLYLEKDQVKKASQEFEKAIQLNANFYHSYISLGLIRFKQGHLKHAEKLFYRVIRLYPYHVGSYLILGEIHARQNDVLKAKAILKKGFGITKHSQLQQALNKLNRYIQDKSK